jgi:hypothetical protein
VTSFILQSHDRRLEAVGVVYQREMLELCRTSTESIIVFSLGDVEKKARLCSDLDVTTSDRKWKILSTIRQLVYIIIIFE